MNTLKSIICNLREQGLSFQEISDKLYSEYGITRSRQAVQSLYSRSDKIKSKTSGDYDLNLMVDAINVYALGYNMTKVHEVLQSFGYDISYQKVIALIKDSSKYMRSIEDTMINNLEHMIDNDMSVLAMKASLSYKGIQVKPDRLNYLINQVIIAKIKANANEWITKSYRITGDRQATKELCNIVGVVEPGDILNKR